MSQVLGEHNRSPLPLNAVTSVKFKISVVSVHRSRSRIFQTEQTDIPKHVMLWQQVPRMEQHVRPCGPQPILAQERVYTNKLCEELYLLCLIQRNNNLRISLLLLANTMKRNPVREADRCSVCYEIPCLLRNPKLLPPPHVFLTCRGGGACVRQ
jgi:hypothetical protein